MSRISGDRNMIQRERGGRPIKRRLHFQLEMYFGYIVPLCQGKAAWNFRTRSQTDEVNRCRRNLFPGLHTRHAPKPTDPTTTSSLRILRIRELDPVRNSILWVFWPELTPYIVGRARQLLAHNLKVARPRLMIITCGVLDIYASFALLARLTFSNNEVRCHVDNVVVPACPSVAIWGNSW